MKATAKMRRPGAGGGRCPRRSKAWAVLIISRRYPTPDGPRIVVLLVRFGELALKSRYVRRQLRDGSWPTSRNSSRPKGSSALRRRTKPASMSRRCPGQGSYPPRAGVRHRVRQPAAEVHATSIPSGRPSSPRHWPPSRRASFALRPRRVGTHPFTSQDLARELGELVRKGVRGSGWTSQTRRRDPCRSPPEPRIRVREIWPGPGGLPDGSQGRASRLSMTRRAWWPPGWG